MSDNQYVFAGYCTDRALPDITPEQAKKLTHLNIAFGVVVDNKMNVDKIRQKLLYLPQIKKYNPKLNILLSTGGGGGKGHGEATKPENIEAFVKSTMDIVREYDLDGIDCDWEFPGDTGHAEEGEQHMQLMKRYREELDKYAEERGRKCWLTIAAGMLKACTKYMDFKALCDVLDFINIMTYDFHWHSKVTGHMTNLYCMEDETDESSEWAVELLRKEGVPYDKMVLGAAFYSHRYDGVKNEGTGLAQPYEGLYSYGPSYTAIYSYYEKSTEYVKYWDDVSKAPYLFNGSSFITYDDPQSMKIKADYVKAKGMKGLMYWVHDSDKTGILFNAMYDALML